MVFFFLIWEKCSNTTATKAFNDEFYSKYERIYYE